MCLIKLYFAVHVKNSCLHFVFDLILIEIYLSFKFGYVLYAIAFFVKILVIAVVLYFAFTLLLFMLSLYLCI